jgi:putative GTP pyrophosphokinase
MTKTPDELRDRAIRFYSRYGPEIDQVKDLLRIKLRQLALAYTINNKLPPEAVVITGRVKTLSSFLKKLERMGYPDFYFPTEIVRDLIGARIVCWFQDDSYGMLEFIKASQHFTVVDNERTPLKDYIKEPQFAGYRAIHVFAEVPYDSVQKSDNKVIVVPENILCEIQIRTKLQDAWADITHEFFYKAKNLGVNNPDYEAFLADISERLAIEDKTFIKFRDVYQRMADEKQAQGQREGFKDEE